MEILEKEKSMRILVVGNRIPWPLHDGGAMATYNLLKSLSTNHQVTFFSYNTKKHFNDKKSIQDNFNFCEVETFELDATPNFKKAIVNTITSRESYFLSRYKSSKAEVQLSGLLKRVTFELVIIEGLYSSKFLQVVRKFSDVPVVYRAHNVESEIWQRNTANTKRFIRKNFLNIQSKRLQREELEFIKSVDAIISISPSDSDYFRKNSESQLFQYLPGFPWRIKVKSKLQPLRVFHIGSMEWEANDEAVNWFVRKIWPLILSVYPDAEFHVAGKGLSKSDNRFFMKAVFNHGEVNDAEEFMINHGICIVPLKAGSGIRMKLLQAMSLGIPCVSTPIGAQGIELNGEPLLIADDAKSFAKQVVSLFADHRKAIELGKRAQKYIESHHSEPKNLEELNIFLQQVTHH